uniref:Uncharacterized protein n=1 Tax=mine drainage metagenome TaxID=410659 RepID=E6PZA1_9ZZZZ
MDGIETGAEQVSFRVQGGIGGKRFFKHGKVAGDARAEVGQRTAGVDEGDEESLAAELGEMDGASILVDELEIGYLVACLWNVELDFWSVIGFGLTDDNEVIDENLSVGALRDEHIGGDHISGVEVAEDARVAELVGHGHGFHEAGNGLTINDDLAGSRVGGDDLSTEGIGFEVLIGGVGDIRGG